MKIKSLKLWQWDISGLNINGLNCGCWKAELEVTIDIEPEHEVNEMEYLTEVNETNEETARGTDKQILTRKIIFQI